MWRRNLLANERTLADVEVFEQQLPRSGILNGFLLRLSARNGTTSNLDNPLRSNINSVEIRDGGRTLLNLTGVQCELVSLLHSWRPPGSFVTEILSLIQTFDVFIPFGNRPFDNELGLDLSLLNNPVIRVDLDLTSVRAVGATGYLTGSATISLIALINDSTDAPSPPSFIKSTEINRFTSAASGDVITQALVDAPWSRLLVRAALTNIRASSVLTDIKIDFDAGQAVIIDEPTPLASAFMSTLQKVYGPFYIDVFRENGDTFDTQHGELRDILVTSEGIVAASQASGFNPGRPTLNCYIDGAVAGGFDADTTDRVRHIKLWAREPYQSLIYDFAEMGLLNATQFDRGQITLTQGVTAAAVSLVLQQHVPNVTPTTRPAL